MFFVLIYQNIYKGKKYSVMNNMVFIPIDCDTQLITTVNKCLNEGGQCDVLTLDFSKAFDKVPHAPL